MRVLEVIEDEVGYCELKVAIEYCDGTEGDCTRIRRCKYRVEEDGFYIENITHSDCGALVNGKDGAIKHFFKDGNLSNKIKSIFLGEI